MFGCYRRSDAADAQTYVAAVAMVLAHYAPDVVKTVTDPYGGLPGRKTENGYSGLPDVAEVKEACENEAARKARMAAYAKLPTPSRRALPAPETRPGAWATVFVPQDSPQYEKFVRRTEKADFREWCYDPKRPGIWVAWSWLDPGTRGMKQFKPFTDAELLDRYGKSSAPAMAEQEGGYGR